MDMQSAKPRVLVVDCHRPVALRFVDLLLEQDDIEVLGPVMHAADAVAYCSQRQPDAIVVDSDTLGPSGLSWVQRIKDEAPELVIIVLSLDGQPSVADAYRSAGATHVLRKHDQFEQVGTLIRAG